VSGRPMTEPIEDPLWGLMLSTDRVEQELAHRENPARARGRRRGDPPTGAPLPGARRPAANLGPQSFLMSKQDRVDELVLELLDSGLTPARKMVRAIPATWQIKTAFWSGQS